MSDDQPSQSARSLIDTSRATAHFVKAILLLMFGSVAAAAGVVISSTVRYGEWTLYAGAVIGVAFVLWSLFEMSVGSANMKS